MKKARSLFLVFQVLVALSAFGQRDTLQFRGDSLVGDASTKKVKEVYYLDSLRTRHILSNRAFRKMSKNYYSYAITGNNTPISGIKITTNSPSVTVSGNLVVSKDKSFILNSQLTGGSQNNLSQIFAGDKLNGYFQATMGANFFFSGLIHGTYTPDNYSISSARAKYKKKVTSMLGKQIDSAVILNQLHRMLSKALREEAPNLPTLDQISETSADTINALYGKAHTSPTAQYIQIGDPTNEEAIAVLDVRKLLIAMMRKYLDDQATDDDQLVKEMADTYLNDASESYDADLKRLGFLGEEGTMESYVDTTAITTLGPLFTKVRFVWLNVLPTISNNSLTFYDTNTKKIADTTSLLYGLSVSINMMRKSIGSYKFIYEQLGFSASRGNNISDLSKFNYQVLTNLSTTATNQSQQTKSGTAYEGKLRQGWGWDQFYEMYWIFTKTQYFPGLYARYDWSYQSVSLNKQKFSPTLGIIWNINSGDNSSASGSKNIISLVPFVNYSNILHNIDPSGIPTKNSDRWSVGINLSLPININNN
jgi:hypothetical protein